ncbi:30S ribosomal protein S2 [Cerasicoccus fimbriatus]|uniref:30S ribosomal protein S2 n=1 Tax=Cerasicoccus fimbriatus TaxID=3014554 RepID=UPI0022B2F099|nr:30S ribosomal protein S2 [Cerasicoccus sp. TK19100]
MNITVKDLLDAGVHFGHQTRRWNPKSKPYVFDHRHGISIINLEKTYALLEKAYAFIEELVASGEDIMFVGTKRQAQEILREAATTCGMPFAVNRWMGGALTNWTTSKASLEKYKRYLRMEADGSLQKLPGKEQAAIRREMARMHRNFEGMLEIKGIPKALFIVDVKNENIAVNEARRLKIPVIALVDTNSDPTIVDLPIPGNDDAVKSIRLVTEVIMEAIQNGLARRTEVRNAPQQGVQPIVRTDFAENEPEVTFADDIVLDEPKKPAATEETPAEPAAEEAPAAEKE